MIITFKADYFHLWFNSLQKQIAHFYTVGKYIRWIRIK